MELNEFFEEKEYDGVIVRRSNMYPKLWAAADGRILGVRGRWLSLLLKNSGTRYGVQYKADKQVNVLAHRLVAETWVLNSDPKQLTIVDHIDGNSLNDRSENLRWVTTRQNGYNKQVHRAKTSSGWPYYGITWDKSKQLWMAQGHFNGHAATIGRYRTKEEAAQAYDAALISAGLAAVNFLTS